MSHSAEIVRGSIDHSADPGVAGPDWSIPRLLMVDNQIRPVKVNDPRILDAMRAIPRERFVTVERLPLAYADQNIPLIDGRVLTEPRVIARLIQALEPRRGERVLVVGAGTGYAACLLDALHLEVFALEQNPALAEQGRTLVGALAPRDRFHEGPLAEGIASEAPFDIVLIDGAVREIPARLAEQLKENGRIGGILAELDKVPVAFLAERQVGSLRPRAQFDCAVPLLPELSPSATFRF